MKLFRTQSEYDRFNQKMSNIFDMEYLQIELTTENNSFIPENYIEPWNKGLKGQQIPWNKGLTKEQDSRLIPKPMKNEVRNKISQTLKGHSVSDATKEKMSITKKGKSPWNKGKKINSENMYKVKVTNGTKIFNSVKEAAEHEKVSSGAIIGRIKRNKNWSYVKTN